MQRARLGLVVPKRQVAQANDRNRLKRVCREVFRQRQLDLPSVDIVVQVLGNQSNALLAEKVTKGLAEVSVYFSLNPDKLGL